MKKKTAPTKRRGHKDSRNNTNLEAQRQRLLTALRKAGAAGINTIQARRDLNILAPAPRVHELRHLYGYNIQTIWTTETTPEGYPHRVARYILMPGKYREVA
ncbi:MAG: helix-turn-helix domain-containing protein [Pseudomonadota bacterium]|nr:helix-turn-helix domain-containing protein [Pseudomonadota bacterium]